MSPDMESRLRFKPTQVSTSTGITGRTASIHRWLVAPSASPIVDALALLHNRLHITNSLNMETGNALTFARDKVVQVWCDRHKWKAGSKLRHLQTTSCAGQLVKTLAPALNGSGSNANLRGIPHLTLPEAVAF